jgi:hypothetical protein
MHMLSIRWEHWGRVLISILTTEDSPKAPKTASLPTPSLALPQANVRRSMPIRSPDGRKLESGNQPRKTSPDIASSDFALHDRDGSGLRNRHSGCHGRAVFVGLDVETAAELLNPLPHSPEAHPAALR